MFVCTVENLNVAKYERYLKSFDMLLAFTVSEILKSRSRLLGVTFAMVSFVGKYQNR